MSTDPSATGLMKGLDRSVNYSRVVEERKISLWLIFCANKLMWVRIEYNIKETEFKDTVKKSRLEIGKLGNLKSDGWTDKLSYRISYNPHNLGYMYYTIYKTVRKQSGYHVRVTLHDRSDCN